MKKWIAACFLPLILTACGTGEYVHSQEPRSTVYYGQPIADLYENFGTPTKAERKADNERVLIYMFQEVEKDWAYRYVRGCVMKFYLVDERVVDWTADGQACVIKSRSMSDMGNQGLALDHVLASGSSILPADAFDGMAPTTYSPIQSVTTPTNTFRGKASASMSRSGQLPADAFDGKASATYIPTQVRHTANSGGIISQVPSDAFGGQASTFYNTNARVQSGTSSIVSRGLPADAFEGKASTNHISSRAQKSFITHDEYDDEEWGLFD